MTFNRIRKLAVPRTATSTFIFYQIEGRPTLTVRPSGEINPQYMNAMFKRSKGVARRLRGGEMSVNLLEETRDIDLDLYPQFVVVGWAEDTVLDDSDQPAPFTPDNVADFLKALPAELFDELRAHCGDLSQFRELADEDVEAIAGN